MSIVNLVIFCQFEPPLDLFSKSGQSDQMTMPARRASKSCAKRRAVMPEVFSQSLISGVISGMIEPWPECQPEESRLELNLSGAYRGDDWRETLGSGAESVGYEGRGGR